MLTLIIGSILIEATLRVFPALIATDLLFLLPTDARQQIAKNRGKLTKKRIQGDGLFFTNKPGSNISETGTVYDINGFRNPSPPKNYVRLALIGASVVEGTGVKKNLGESLIQMGIDTYTLAVPAWGPGQYRDAYKKFIINKNIKNDITLTLTSIPRDQNIATTYAHAKATGGDWQDFFGRPKLIGLSIKSQWMPWTLSIYNKLPYHLLSLLRKRNPKIQLSQKSIKKQLIIELDYEDYKVNPNYFKPINLLGSWDKYEEIIGDHTRSIKKHGSRPIIAYLPSPPMLLIPFVQGEHKLKDALNRQMEFDRKKIKTLAVQYGGEFLDLGSPIRDNIKHIKIIRSPNNAHFTQKGIDFVASIILRHIEALNP
jgi:hypothetical protein